MSKWYLAWKNLMHHPSRFIFNILLIGMAVSLLVIILLINKQMSQHFEKNASDVDLILCAKGSPLQSVLCNIMHIDAPTGNISISEIKPFLNSNHPIIKRALPIAIGDSYQGYRIVGVTTEYFDWYSLHIERGQFFNKDFQLVLGSEVASKYKLNIGDTLQSSHGLVGIDDEHHHENDLIVNGILKNSGGIQDRLIFISISSYWNLHEHEVDDEHIHHEQNVLSNQELVNYEKTITSLLVKFKGTNIQSLNFGRSINENTNVMAVNPAIELNRLYELTGSASELLNLIGIILSILAFIAIFINLSQALNERKFEIALIRIGGGSRTYIAQLLIFEGFILSFTGIILGLILGHIILFFSASKYHLADQYGIQGHYFCIDEIYVLFIGLVCGLIATILPVIRASSQNIHHTISKI